MPQLPGVRLCPVFAWIDAEVAVAALQVGYGDISPSFYGTQLLFIVMFSLFVTVLPYQTSALLEAMLEHSPYQRAAYKRKPAQSHAIITGWLDQTTLKTALEELLHQEHGLSKVHVVILNPRPPSTEIKNLIASYLTSGTVEYIQGSATSPTVSLRPAPLQAALCLPQPHTALLLLARPAGSPAAPCGCVHIVNPNPCRATRFPGPQALPGSLRRRGVHPVQQIHAQPVRGGHPQHNDPAGAGARPARAGGQPPDRHERSRPLLELPHWHPGVGAAQVLPPPAPRLRAWTPRATAMRRASPATSLDI